MAGGRRSAALTGEHRRDGPGHDLEIDAEFKKLQDHSYFRSLTDGFPLNQEVHFPEERKNAYSKPEINSAIKTIEAFIKFTNSLPIYKK